jgi:hypothetical protein
VQASASPMPVALARLASKLKCSSSLRERLCLQARGLTLPSRGHTTAGHDCSLRQHWRRRRVPLTSNVRPHEKGRLQAVNLVALSNAQARAGRPSAGGRGTPEVAAEVRCQRSRGPSVARAASAPPVRLGRIGTLYGAAPSPHRR